MTGKPKLFTLRTFSAGVFLLIQKAFNEKDEVIIDIEYDGNDVLIKDILMEMFERSGRKTAFPRIIFRQIGRKSKAHSLAISVYRKDKRADRVIEYSELERFAIKKSR